MTFEGLDYSILDKIDREDEDRDLEIYAKTVFKEGNDEETE